MIKDFKDSKITSDLKPLSAISTVSTEVTLNTMLKYCQLHFTKASVSVPEAIA